MRNKTLAAHWRCILEALPDYEHPELTRKAWRDQVAKHGYLYGYAHAVSAMLFAKQVKTPVPAVLQQFKPKGRWTAKGRNAVIASFLGSKIQYDTDPRSGLWFAMAHCFENLTPFVVLKANGTDEFAVAADSSELRKELEGDDGYEIIYAWDGLAVPRYNDI